MSSDLVVAINMGLIDCHARHGGGRMTLNCRAHSKSAKLEGWKKQRRGDIAMHKVRPKGRNLSIEVVSLLFRHKAHTEDVLTCGTHIHG